MTIIDGLTQAYNKRYFVENLEKEIPRCTRHQRPLSLVMFDIDHFKKINDEHGHLTGDYVLRELARRVRTRVRKEEVFARYGGEEFALTLPETSRDQSMKVAEDLRRLVSARSVRLRGRSHRRHDLARRRHDGERGRRRRVHQDGRRQPVQSQARRPQQSRRLAAALRRRAADDARRRDGRAAGGAPVDRARCRARAAPLASTRLTLRRQLAGRRRRRRAACSPARRTARGDRRAASTGRRRRSRRTMAARRRAPSRRARS